MKRLLVIALIFSGLVNISAQEIILLNYKVLEKKFDKSEGLIKDEKKGIASKTWYDRGKLLQDIYRIDLEYIAEGSGLTELKLYYKEPIEEVTAEEDPNTKTLKYTAGPQRACPGTCRIPMSRNPRRVSQASIRVKHKRMVNPTTNQPPKLVSGILKYSPCSLYV